MVKVSVFLKIGEGGSTLQSLPAFISKEVLQRITSTCIVSRGVDKDHGKVVTDDVSVFLKIGEGGSTLPPLPAFITKEVLQRITSTCIASRGVDKDHGEVAITDRLSVCGPSPWSKSVPLSGMYVDHFSSKNQIAMCNTYTHGGGDVWYPSPSGLLMHWRPTKRFTCPSHGDPLFIRASCIHSINRCYNGSLVAFLAKEDIGWRLGIVCQLHYLDEGGGPDGDGWIGLWKWKREHSNKESNQFTPQLMHSQSWGELLTHMEYDKFPLQDIQLYYLNQIKGPVPLGLSIPQDTRNQVDGGIQSSPGGPDLWSMDAAQLEAAQAHNESSTHISFDQFKIDKGDSPCPNLLVTNRMKTGSKGRKKQDHIRSRLDENSDAYQWHHGAPSKIPAKSHMCLVVVVKDKSGADILPDQAGLVPSSMSKTLNYGSIVSANNKQSSVQPFFCMSPAANKQLCDKYREGMPLGKNPDEEIDEILSRHASGNVHTLFSTDKVHPPCPIHYHGFTRIFAGKDTPPTDKSFFVCKDIPLHTIYFKFVESRKYCQYPPLSIGFHDYTFHKLKIQPSFVRIIKSALGSRGSYAGGRCTNIHEGHLSFVGPRKVGRMNQPTVQEGPKEKLYWYHKEQNDHRFLPFVVSLVTSLGGATSVAPYHFYRHLNQLYQHVNSTDTRLKFCPRVILTVDFYNSCHTDKNDLDPKETKQMVTRLKDILTIFDQLVANGLKVMKSRTNEAVKSLEHLMYWGFCLPTTCCYQYLFKTTAPVEIYQWFMCPGLGTTYRIRNYWVHIMLGGLFSHCTSAPIYIVDNKAYFGKCPAVTMFAWGGT